MLWIAFWIIVPSRSYSLLLCVCVCHVALHPSIHLVAEGGWMRGKESRKEYRYAKKEEWRAGVCCALGSISRQTVSSVVDLVSGDTHTLLVLPPPPTIQCVVRLFSSIHLHTLLSYVLCVCVCSGAICCVLEETSCGNWHPPSGMVGEGGSPTPPLSPFLPLYFGCSCQSTSCARNLKQTFGVRVSFFLFFFVCWVPPSRHVGGACVYLSRQIFFFYFF